MNVVPCHCHLTEWIDVSEVEKIGTALEAHGGCVFVFSLHGNQFCEVSSAPLPLNILCHSLGGLSLTFLGSV